MNRPKHIQNIEITHVDDDTVVYDSESKQVHCLEGIASEVFSRCDGQHSAEEITKKLRQEGSEVNQDEVDGVLNQLLSLKILKDTSWTRREVLTRAAAAVLVTSVLAPSPAAAQSVTTTPGTTTTSTTPTTTTTTSTTPAPTTTTTPPPTTTV